MTTALLVFTKAPVPGRVNTRLQPALSPQAAADLQCRLIERTLTTVSESRLPSQLWIDRPHPFLRARAETLGIPCFRQSGENLGQRMQRAAARALASHEAVVIIGTDCPALDTDYLHRAGGMLASRDAVLGPAIDGGYVLLGLRRADAQVFAGVTWSSPAVLEQTRDNLRRLGWRWAELEALRDIDRPEDLAWMRATMPAL